ncbi:hypothetical protein [Luteolibacter luteus]|uniref:Uncharacterized protein n=1 Tax=Luteolibacter luteus TaxID=2728835 RepID=A0A858RB74_9BACT|nr:hypothetical protein [Luteolibacter luteus]QJE94236.1 hypothetical protein HHL09_00035 [Luteolibacter luteus]
MSSPVIRDFSVFWEPNAMGVSYLMKTPAEDADKKQIREATRLDETSLRSMVEDPAGIPDTGAWDLR